MIITPANCPEIDRTRLQGEELSTERERERERKRMI